MFHPEKVTQLAEAVKGNFGEGLPEAEVKAAAIMLNDDEKVFEPGDKQFWIPLVWNRYQEL